MCNWDLGYTQLDSEDLCSTLKVACWPAVLREIYSVLCSSAFVAAWVYLVRMCREDWVTLYCNLDLDDLIH